MFQESFLCVLAFCLAIVPLGIAMYRVKTSGAAATWTVALLWLAAPATLLWAAIRHREPVVQESPVAYRPIEVTTDGYVGSESCRHCHPHHHATWHASYHRTMTQVASPESVIGDFENVELTWRGETVRLKRIGDEFWAEMDEPLWSSSDQPAPRISVPIVMTTGSHHYQAYWYPSGHGRVLGNLKYVYLSDEQEWIPRPAAFITPPEPTFRGHELSRWNFTCSECHTTHSQPRSLGQSDADFDSVDTQVAEFGIACEACHGPGETHVQTNLDVTRRYRLHFTEAADPTIVNPERLSAKLSTQVCGRCHSVFLSHNLEVRERRVSGLRFRPGQELSDSMLVVRHREADKQPMIQEAIEYDPEFLDNRFWKDGMVRVSGREYNGLLETPCYQHGEMSCMSCHAMHKPADDPRPLSEWANDQLTLGMRSNQACTQCHEEYRQEETLTAHSHHAVSSTGSLCYNCHMPHTTFGLLKAIRSHQIDKPNVSVTLATGRPNACNQCHLDKTLAWTAEQLHQWYDLPKPQMEDDEKHVAASILQLLKGDAGQRALAACNLGWEPARQVSGEHWMAPYLAQLLLDPYHAVRYAAFRSLKKMPGFQDFEYDFLTPRENRMSAGQGAMLWWNRVTSPEDRPKRPELLYDSRGQLDRSTYDRLFKQRNDRLMSLDE